MSIKAFAYSTILSLGMWAGLLLAAYITWSYVR